jgi:hypothetical protein
MSGSSGLQHPRTCVGHASQNSGASTFNITLAHLGLNALLTEDLAMPQVRTPQLSSLGEGVFPSDQAHEGETDLMYFEPSSEYGCLEYSISESPARSGCEVEPQLGHDKGSPGILERNSYRPDPLPLPPSFAALEFPTSPLPPSSPLPSSTAYGSLLSHRQVSHGPETTTLGWDSFPLPSTLSGSCEAGSSSRYGHNRPRTPDLAPGSPVRHLPDSAPAYRVPNLRAPSSKDDLIPELLTCDNPWNVIGDILDLPPIPPADDGYFGNIRSLHWHTLSHEGVSSPATSWSLGRVDIGEPSRAPRHAGTQLRAVHSDGDLIRPGPSRLALSREASHRTSPLPCQDPPNQIFLSPAAVPFHSGCGARLLGRAASRRSSSPSSECISALSGASRSLLETQCPVASPRPLEATSGIGRDRSPIVEKTLSPFSCILTPQGSIPPYPKNLDSPTTSVSHTEVMSRQSNPTAEFDLAALIPNVPRKTYCCIEAQLPKLECPDLFQDDDEDSLGSMF